MAAFLALEFSQLLDMKSCPGAPIPDYFLPLRDLWAPPSAGVWVLRPPVSSPVSLSGSPCRLESRLWTAWCPLAVASVSSSLGTGRPGKLEVKGKHPTDLFLTIMVSNLFLQNPCKGHLESQV